MADNELQDGRKRVAIIGAGPAGLVAAKTFLDTGRFRVYILEKKSRVGGIWALDENSKDGFLAPNTPVNLSRFSVGFSDLDWREISISSDDGSRAALETPSGEKNWVPMFPKAWMAGRYLDEYRRRYVPQDCILLNTEVTSMSRFFDSNKKQQWRLTLTQVGSDEAVAPIDVQYVVVASGFFSQPRSPSWIGSTPDDGRVVNGTGNSHAAPKSIHSSQFRTLDDLFPPGQDVSGKKILMIGGGNSAGETAGNVALHLSAAQWSPENTGSVRFRDTRIVHVTPRPLYSLPPFDPISEDSRSYAPLDFILYDLSKRPAHPIQSSAGSKPQALHDIIHGIVQGFVGGDQSDLAESLVSPDGAERGAPYVALSETYSEFVRQGIIEVVGGRCNKISSAGDQELKASVSKNEEADVEIDEIAAVIYATGYTPAAALHFLPDDVKEQLDYDETSLRLPLILDQWQTVHPKVRDLAFLGFYEGPYWGVIEMQARLTVNNWVADLEAGAKGHGSQLRQHRAYETAEHLLQLRREMRAKSRLVPQYWFGDYLGYMEEIARELDCLRNDGEFKEREGCVSPARYLAGNANMDQANSIMTELHKVWHECRQKGTFVARAAFRAMQGNWTINRTIESKGGPLPSGSLEGTASFHPRFPTSDKSGKTFDLEYVYVESGTFTTTTGQSMSATRRYVYRYLERDDRLSVWFVKPDAPLEVDYLFHDLTFITPDEARKESACVAKADHLCVKDMYWTEYRLPLKGIALNEGFQVKHTVKGPQKDYVATTRYARPLRSRP